MMYVYDAIKKTKGSKALGLDGISPIMLKYLGEHGVKYLTKVINLSLQKTYHTKHLENSTYHCFTETWLGC